MKQKLISTSIRIAAATTVLGLLGQTSSLAFASSWDPTLLVNTESFSTIDDGDGTTNIEVRFGDTVDERVYWDVTRGMFEFTDDLHVQR